LEPIEHLSYCLTKSLFRVTVVVVVLPMEVLHLLRRHLVVLVALRLERLGPVVVVGLTEEAGLTDHQLASLVPSRRAKSRLL